MENKVIKELNNFLEGNFMAIHAYEKYIEHIDNTEIKQVFQKIQQDHKQHALIIAERIQNLDGVPVDDAGFKGTMAQFANSLKGSTTETISILKDALVGEERGIKVSKELVKGDLDQASLTLVKKILSHDQKHIEELDHLIQQIKS